LIGLSKTTKFLTKAYLDKVLACKSLSISR
jgi:hypothetical protein